MFVFIVVSQRRRWSTSDVHTNQSPLHSVSEDGRACQECMSPALGGVMLPQAHLRYGLARSRH